MASHHFEHPRGHESIAAKVDSRRGLSVGGHVVVVQEPQALFKLLAGIDSMCNELARQVKLVQGQPLFVVSGLFGLCVDLLETQVELGEVRLPSAAPPAQQAAAPQPPSSSASSPCNCRAPRSKKGSNCCWKLLSSFKFLLLISKLVTNRI